MAVGEQVSISMHPARVRSAAADTGDEACGRGPTCRRQVIRHGRLRLVRMRSHTTGGGS